ncbi:MAG: nodulation protein NfeD [Nitrospirota bacterium]|nr:MAG: nodulation protein NfeD [Nitrospirota bacterium]
MSRKYALALIMIVMLFVVPSSRSDTSTVLVINVESVINPVSSEFITKSIKKANEGGFEAILIKLDTPGGLDTSMRDIIKAINASDIPVIVYVSPSGARAASAGVFITMSAHVAAMAPGTNIGAAHPVGVGGKMDKTMKEKATNDAVAYIKSIADERGRNVKWAEDAVRKSVSATDQEALELNIIDLRAASVKELLGKIDGRKVNTVSAEKVLSTAASDVQEEEMSFRLRLLGVISDPNIAYILMLLGFYGLFFELTNPGSIFPGVIGGICLILAFYSFQTLPVNYAGVLLIILAIIMFILEVKIVSFGILTIGGIISMVIGSIMLFDRSIPFMRLSLATILPVVIVTVAFFSIAIRFAYKAWKSKPITGEEGLSGSEGVALSDISDEGMALVHGEYWRASSDTPIAKGEKLIVVSLDGLKIKVKKI